MSVNLKEIFGRGIKIESKVRSISGVFFNKENLKQTDYQPSYQRNYVWDDEKASYFIESIFLGTEIPPLIYFKSEKDGEIHNEVIDGRQRYQSILRFVEGDLKLKKKGLQKLGDISGFSGNSYKELSDDLKDLFEETKIRVIEFSFLAGYTLEEEERVKKEIFQRYNSGITPLKNSEIDKAQYLDNGLNSFFKEKLDKDSRFNHQFTSLFRLSKSTSEQKAMKLRELSVLYRIPIKYYAIQKQKVIRKYFDILSEQITEDDIDDLFNSIKEKIELIGKVEQVFKYKDVSFNRLLPECLFWAFSIYQEEKQSCIDLSTSRMQALVEYFSRNISIFSMERSSFAGELFNRYETTAKFFEKEFDCDFNLYLYNSEKFKKDNKEKVRPQESYSSISFDELRINKPEPTSVEITEFLRTIKRGRFLIRPPYQRNEVRNRKKSSSIVESLLLGIKLPPIFVFKRTDGVSEVIDGQQRLLSIIGFMGEKYLDEKEKEQESRMNKFCLDLKDNGILKDLHGFNFDALEKVDQNKIRNSEIWVIEINGRTNKDFDPVDLFIRLNNKPYPIPKDSFEMWNSFASRTLIDTIKLACTHNEKWFYLRKNNSRMDNENLFTTLSYFQMEYLKSGMKSGEVAPNRTIEIYNIGKRINCRFRFRNDISKIMEQDDHTLFVKSVNILEFGFLKNLEAVIGYQEISSQNLKEGLDDLLNFDSKRTQMMFYILWVLLHDLSLSRIIDSKEEIKKNIKVLVNLASKCYDVNMFKKRVLEFRDKYKADSSEIKFKLRDVVDVIIPKEETIYNIDIVIEPMVGTDGRFPVQSLTGKVNLPKHQVGLKINRDGINPRYIECFLRSKFIAKPFSALSQKLSSSKLQQFEIPYICEQTQHLYGVILSYIDNSTGLERKYFERMMDLMVYELVYPEKFKTAEISIIDIVRSFPDLADCENDNDRKKKVATVYEKQSNNNSKLSLQLLKSIDLDF